MMSNYDVNYFEVDEDLANCLYYGGVAISVTVYPDTAGEAELIMHYDEQTNIGFYLLLNNFLKFHGERYGDTHPPHKFYIEAKGE